MAERSLDLTRLARKATQAVEVVTTAADGLSQVLRRSAEQLWDVYLAKTPPPYGPTRQCFELWLRDLLRNRVTEGRAEYLRRQLREGAGRARKARRR